MAQSEASEAVNPYRPPAGTDAPLSNPTRSAKAVGAGSISTAAIGILIGALWSLALIPRPEISPEMLAVDPALAAGQAAYEAQRPVSLFIGLEGAVFFVTSVLLLVVGIGQRRLRSWAIGATKAWCMLAGVEVLGHVLFSILVVGPSQPVDKEAFTFVYTLGLFLALTPFPVVLVLLQARKSFRDAFQSDSSNRSR